VHWVYVNPATEMAYVEYAADLAKRYFVEQRTVLGGGTVARPFKCLTAENAEAWALLAERFFGARVSILRARFSRRLTSSFGNANPQRRTVQVAERLRNAPRWVIDYVLIHEIAHLIEPGHGRRFWELVNRYRYSERAQGYLACLSETEA